MKYTGKKEDITYISDIKHTNEQTEKAGAVSIAVRIIGLILAALELVLSGILIYRIADFNVFSTKIILIISAILLALLAIVIIFNRVRVKGLNITGLIMSAIICTLLGISSYYITLTNDVIDNITGTGYSVKTYKVAVLKDDPADTLADAAGSGYTFGTVRTLESEEFEDALKEINKQAGTDIMTEDYTKVGDLYHALLDKKNEAIIFESAFEKIFEEENEFYLDDIKFIAEIKIRNKTKEADNVSKVNVINDPFILFISGNDQYDEISTTGRSDVNMLAVVNPQIHQVLLVSIPRDYYVTFPGVTGDSRDKLTHSGIYGIDVQLETIKNIFDIEEIEYYMMINFTSLINIVDALGGVDFYNPYGFGATYEPYYYPEGDIHLNGTEALFYARERKSIPGGDFARGQHQQILLEAMINQLQDVVYLAAHYPEVMAAIHDCSLTNMPEEDIKALVNDQLNSGASWDIEKIQADGLEDVYQPSFAAGGMALSVVMPYKASIDYISGLIKKVMAGEKVENVAEKAPSDTTFVTELIDIDESYDESYYEVELDPEYAEPAPYIPSEDEYIPQGSPESGEDDPIGGGSDEQGPEDFENYDNEDEPGAGGDDMDDPAPGDDITDPGDDEGGDQEYEDSGYEELPIQEYDGENEEGGF